MSADVQARPFAYLARVRWGDEVLAESRTAVRVDGDGAAPQLWFPWADVRADLLRAAGAEPGSDASFDRYDAEGPAPARSGPVAWGDDGETAGPHDGVGVARRWVRPPLALAALEGHVAFDHDRAIVEVVDAVAGEDPRDATVKRFPTWGDAADLVAILDRGVVVRDTRRPVVEGSQMLGQAIVAAMRHAPTRRVVSAHLAFLRAADANQPLAIELDELADGRTFTALAARATQGPRLLASGTLLLGVPSTDVVAHHEGIDGVAGPYAAVPYDMGVTGRDLRVVDAAYSDDPDEPVGPPSIDAWVRFREVPDDPAIHAGLLAQFTGHMSIAAALRPHAGVGQREAHRTISTAINAIGISFHAEVRMDRWVLYRHVATVVADGMAHAEGRVHDGDGGLVASFTVDAMIRPLAVAAGGPPPDARTAL